MTHIGTNLKKIRKVKGLSQQAFADLFSLTRGNISSYEELRAEPRLSVILQIAKYFGIPVAQFIDKKLTVNEILNFEDHFLDKKSGIEIKNVQAIPFFNRNVFQQSNKSLFLLENLPKIYLPLQHNVQIIAIENTSAIPQPTEFPFEENTILFFEQVQVDILHTLNEHYGFFLNDNDFFFGKYKVEGKNIDLVLNDWKSARFSETDQPSFWKLYAKFEKVL